MTEALLISDNLNIAESIKYGFSQVGINSFILSVNELLAHGLPEYKCNQFVIFVVSQTLRKSIDEVNTLIKGLSTRNRFYLLFEGNFDLRISIWADQTKWVFRKVGIPNALKLAIDEISRFETEMVNIKTLLSINNE